MSWLEKEAKWTREKNKCKKIKKKYREVYKVLYSVTIILINEPKFIEIIARTTPGERSNGAHFSSKKFHCTWIIFNAKTSAKILSSQRLLCHFFLEIITALI